MSYTEFIHPNWSAPPSVRALQTTRLGGVSDAPFDRFNLAQHVGDAPESVAQNRQLLAQNLPSAPCWLNQIHSNIVVNASPQCQDADASFTRQRGVVCAVMTADCLPILLCDQAGSVVAAIHAGWKGLAAGIIEATVRAMELEPAQLLAWFGPAIGQAAFEVGGEVRDTFIAQHAQAIAAFMPNARGKWQADIYLLAHQRLNALGITHVSGGDLCTFQDKNRFYSYRRDGVTGRMASLIWLE